MNDYLKNTLKTYEENKSKYIDNTTYTDILREGKCFYHCILTGKFICDECKFIKEPYYSKEEFNEIVKHKQQTITLIDEYTNKKTRIKYKCNNCGSISSAIPSKLIHGNVGCLKCRTSNGEMAIEKFLIDNSIKYEREKRFDKCKYKRHLRFDFYLPELNTAIEFDGRQHFTPVDSFGGYTVYKDIVTRDKIKNKFCKNNNINLLRIPYYCKDIIGTLKTELNI